jgi:O-antigen/teichoic acid export membrane protein
VNKWIVKYKQSDVKHEIKDVFYLIALQGVNYIAPLLVLPYLMIVLGAEKFGYIGFSLAVTQYLMTIIDFGFNLRTTKRVALK